VGVADGESEFSFRNDNSDSAAVTDNVTRGESESSRRRDIVRSINVTPEMKRLDDIRRRKYVGTDIATADEARKTAQWCTLCRASLTEQPVYYGRARVHRGRYRGRDQKVPLCAECFGPYAQHRELEKCDTCGREGWFCVALVHLGGS
jgi:hypothetical protein